MRLPRSAFAIFLTTLSLTVAHPALATPEAAATPAPHAPPTRRAAPARASASAAKATSDATFARRVAAASQAKGLYVRGETAARSWIRSESPSAVLRKDYDTLIERSLAHGLDTIVLDAKDYDGLLTYTSRVPLAVASGATKNAPLSDLRVPIERAQARGLRVAVRISCFEDELMTKARPQLSVVSKAGRPYPIGWLDPSNAEVQAYVIDLVKEALDAGADEIQLDYVRYPVLGIKNADFRLEGRGLTKPIVIRDFVRKVHAVTRARSIPLSLDVFGVVAFGKRDDIDRLGQDPALLASECEVLSPMVYPSHYAPGFYGFDEPGDHPELVGMAVKAIKSQIENAGVSRGAVIRPWLQAMAWKSPTFSSSYIAREIRSSNEAGGSGFLLWNPGQTYGASFAALPAVKAAAKVATAAKPTGTPRMAQERRTARTAPSPKQRTRAIVAPE